MCGHLCEYIFMCAYVCVLVLYVELVSLFLSLSPWSHSRSDHICFDKPRRVPLSVKFMPLHYVVTHHTHIHTRRFRLSAKVYAPALCCDIDHTYSPSVRKSLCVRIML